MIVIKIMGRILDQQLQARGIYSIGSADCEAIAATMLEKSAKVAAERPMTQAQAEDILRRST